VRRTFAIANLRQSNIMPDDLSALRFIGDAATYRVLAQDIRFLRCIRKCHCSGHTASHVPPAPSANHKQVERNNVAPDTTNFAVR
jgi:hypothetical protein